jgi:hypothetical protein
MRFMGGKHTGIRCRAQPSQVPPDRLECGVDPSVAAGERKEKVSTIDNRRHPRYAAELPVAFTLGEVVASESAYLSNISSGGLSFNSMVALEPGTVIMLHLPPSKPVFRTPARVVWCRKMNFQYAVGVEFLSDDRAFRERMVAMVQHVETYRQEAQRAGRHLDGQQATLEWIELHGREFFGP